jgi:hypothetical protein
MKSFVLTVLITMFLVISDGSILDSAAADDRLLYNRDIRPILSDRCFFCHGPDPEHREADLRLDDRDAAVAGAMVPGNSGESELLARMLSTDPDTQMPPPESGKSVSEAEIETIRRWIDQGAEYQGHWAFERVRRPGIPELDPGEVEKYPQWNDNPVDRFLLQRMLAAGLQPSDPADRETLIRRVTLDLTGLPPTPAEVAAFADDDSANAWEKVIDRLQSSPHYGERMALNWLDYARYADSNGFQSDGSRDIWAWRDWVIAAYNRNLPFDQFTIDQLAGDMLPGATTDQIIATGFNRNHRLNGEGGFIPEEWFVETVIDRVETTGLTWMGLTFNCCRCHDHKYDPISQKEFFQFFAFFNSVDETGVLSKNGKNGENTPPLLTLWKPDQESHLAELKQTAKVLGARLKKLEKQFEKLDKQSPDSIKETQTSQRAANKAVKEYEKTLVTTMVMKEGAMRDAFVLQRGEYDRPGEKVERALPAFLPPLPPGAPVNRLGLARWIVSRENPLTARVWVNREWERFFGNGIVKTTENFGSQAEFPTHPDLLDWLAIEFMEPTLMPDVGDQAAHAWDMKSFQKMILISAAYRQSSDRSSSASINDRRDEIDPTNRLLSYAPRIRLQGEVIRDQALAVSGLMVADIGGPSVRPYMPAGVWDETSKYGNLRNYQPDDGLGLYRRTIYTIWKRTAAPPSMLLFDAPSREACTIKRSRTNTPLQALSLLNEITFVESARQFAVRLMSEGGSSDESRLTLGFQLATARRPTRDELKILVQGLQQDRTRFEQDPESAKALLSVGKSPSATLANTLLSELAAWTLTANILLNLDEVVTRE